MASCGRIAPEGNHAGKGLRRAGDCFSVESAIVRPLTHPGILEPSEGKVRTQLILKLKPH